MFAEQGKLPSFGEYLEHYHLGVQTPQPPPPKPKKSAKELIAWAQGLTEKARAEKAKESS